LNSKISSSNSYIGIQFVIGVYLIPNSTYNFEEGRIKPKLREFVNFYGNTPVVGRVEKFFLAFFLSLPFPFDKLNEFSQQ
jgi:hypothetical protein